MGIFGNSAFDQDVEKATGENNGSEDWALILEICDRASASPTAARECLRAVTRRLAHTDPHVQLQAATLLDACVANCGRPFLLEVASRDFLQELRRLMARSQAQVSRRLRSLLRKWAENEFRGDAQLDLVPSLYQEMRSKGFDFEATPAPSAAATPAPAAAAAAAQREQDELARAIALSLRESNTANTGSTLYPRVDEAPAPSATTANAAPAGRKVRALYDFEAAEDNELTFLAGEIVMVTDASDPNWWKGTNERGEGLFPANFVTADLSAPTAAPAKSELRSGKSVQFAEAAGPEGASAVEEFDSGSDSEGIDEAALDRALAALHEASPEAGGEDEAALARRESRALRQCGAVDAALQRADKRHARLTQLSAELVDALNLYHHLMREPMKPYGPPPGQQHMPLQFYAPAPGAPPAPPPPHLAHLLAPAAPPPPRYEPPR